MIFAIVKLILRCYSLVLLFITGFLLGFLLIGCLDPTSLFSNVYLSKFEFNKTSDLYSNVRAAYKSTNSSTELAEMSIRVGYLGVCVNIQQNMTCTSFSTLNTLANVSGISIIPTSTKSTQPQLDLVGLAKVFSNICHPHILMTVIILVLVMLLLITYSSIPGFPGRQRTTMITTGFALCTVLLWGLGAMLQYECVSTTKKIVAKSSMGVISAGAGSRAQAMSWTSFAFIFIVFLDCVYRVVRILRENKKRGVAEKC